MTDDQSPRSSPGWTRPLDPVAPDRSINASRMDVLPKLGSPSNVSAVNAAVRNAIRDDKRARAQRRSTIVPSERPFLDLKNTTI